MVPAFSIFRSVRFNIGLLCVIAVASAVGTVLPQASETPEKVEAWLAAYPAWGAFFDRLGLFRLYESWWYLALLGLMAFDIVVCKLGKLPPDTGLVSLPPELDRDAADAEHLEKARAAARQKPLKDGFRASRDSAAAVERASALLAAEGYAVQHGLSSGDGPGRRAAFIATRHRVQRWGSYVAHVALVVILVGGLLKQLYGFVEMVPVLEGGSRAMQNKPEWELWVDKFTVLYYEGTGSPKHFSSDLRVTEGEKLLAQKKIIVNDPLDIDGVRFYQASWGAGGMFRSVTLQLGKQLVQVAQRTPTPIPGTKIKLVAEMLLPNFDVGPDRRATSRSLDLRNPAVMVKFLVEGRETRSLWLLQHAPGVAFMVGEDGALEDAPPPPFRLVGIDPVLFSGVQVAYDPGYPVVLAGGIAWLVGMMLLFYMHRRRLWVVVDPAGTGESEVIVGAWSSRGPKEFEREFEGVMARLKRELGEKGPASPGPVPV